MDAGAIEDESAADPRYAVLVMAGAATAAVGLGHGQEQQNNSKPDWHIADSAAQAAAQAVDPAAEGGGASRAATCAHSMSLLSGASGSPAPAPPGWAGLAQVATGSTSQERQPTSEQQHGSCTEPSTPGADPAELMQATYWQSLQQQQQPMQQSLRQHMDPQLAPGSRHRTPSSSAQASPSRQMLPAQLLLQDVQRMDAVAGSTGPGISAALQGVEGSPASPFSPNSTDLLQQLQELQQQVAALTRQANRSTGSLPSASSPAKLSGQHASQGPGQSAGRGGLANPGSSVLDSARMRQLQALQHAQQQMSPQHSPSGLGMPHAGMALFNRVDNASSLTSNSFDSRASSARPARAATPGHPLDGQAARRAGSRLAGTLSAQPGQTAGYYRPDSTADVQPGVHDTHMNSATTWQQLMNRMLARPSAGPTLADLEDIGGAASDTQPDSRAHATGQPMRSQMDSAVHSMYQQGSIGPSAGAGSQHLYAGTAASHAASALPAGVQAMQVPPAQQLPTAPQYAGQPTNRLGVSHMARHDVWHPPAGHPDLQGASTASAWPASGQHTVHSARGTAYTSHPSGVHAPAADAHMQAFPLPAHGHQPAALSGGLTFNPVASAQPAQSGVPAATPVQQPGPTAQNQHSPATPAPGTFMQAMQDAALPVQAAAASTAALQQPAAQPQATVLFDVSGTGAVSKPSSPGLQVGQIPAPMPMTEQQQLEYLVRLQHLQLLQVQMQAPWPHGGPLGFAGLPSAALQAPPHLATLWGLPALHPGMQLQHMLLAQPGTVGHSAAAPTAHPAPAGAVPGAAAVAVNTLHADASALHQAHSGSMQRPLAEHGSQPAIAARGNSSQAPIPAAPSPFAAAAAASGSIDSTTSWLSTWMPLSRRSTGQHVAVPLQHSQDAAAVGLSAAELVTAGAGSSDGWIPVRQPVLPTSMLQLALFPVTAPLAAVVGGSSLMLQALWAVGSTATSASVWSAHSAAMACVRISQYQLLVLLCCLTAAAAAAQAAGSVAAAAARTSRLVVQVADREARMFGRAAAVVAFTDMRQLCRQLATQPLLLVQGQQAAQVHMQPAHSSPASTAASLPSTGSAALGTEHDSAAGAPSSTRTFSRGLSGLLGGLFGTAAGGPVRSHLGSTRSTPRASLSISRRCSGSGGPMQLPGGHAAAGTLASTVQDGAAPCGTVSGVSPIPSSQELMVHARQHSTSMRLSASVHGAAAGPSGVPGVSARTLILYDSLAVVSGLWAGMWMRLWLLFMLQGPLASARIWLAAAKTAVQVSAAATVATTKTAMQAAWALSHLSLVVLGSAAATSASGPSGRPFQSSSAAAVGAPARTTWGLGLMGHPSAGAAVLAMLQWLWMQAARPWFSMWCYLGAAVASSVPGGLAAAKIVSRWRASALTAFAALSAAFSQALVWLGSIQDAGLFSRAGMQATRNKGLQLAGLLAAWLLSWGVGMAEGVTVLVAEWVLKDVPPVGKAAVYGSARMIKGLVVEASRQSGQLAGQLLEAWRLHNA